MTVLDTLTLTKTMKTSGYDPVRLRRRKLADAIQEQINLLRAEAEGLAYAKVVRKRTRDLETDDVAEQIHRRRISPWWWTDDAGGVNVSVRYGSMQLELKDGLSTFTLGSTAEVADVLSRLRGDAIAGRLDQQLAAASLALRGRFQKPSPKRKK